MRRAGRLGLGVLLVSSALASVTPAGAAQHFVLPPGLQQAAILCLGEALRLCPNALAAQDHGIACIRGKRRLLTKTCRTVYDQGLSLLKGGDVHLDLRALKAHPPRSAAQAGASKPKP